MATVRVRVSPGASRSEVVGPHGDAWKVRVAAPADAGRANDALVRLLSETLDIPRRDVSIVSGQSGRDKIVSLSNLDDAEVRSRLGSRP
jgi:uncharacterized protein (TIGR00251 family)